MNTITVTLSDERLSELKVKADELGLTPEELVRVSIEELLSRPEATFQQAVEYVLKKNKELYQRLA